MGLRYQLILPKNSYPKLRTYPLRRIRRSFNSRWYVNLPFIVQNDAVYCFTCRFFPSVSHTVETTFTVKGMCDRKKNQSKLEKHSRSDCNKSLWVGYKQESMVQLVSSKTIQENRQYLKSICQFAVLCARQDIEHHEHEGQENFLEILDLVVFSEKMHARFSSKCKVCIKIYPI